MLKKKIKTFMEFVRFLIKISFGKKEVRTVEKDVLNDYWTSILVAGLSENLPMTEGRMANPKS